GARNVTIHAEAAQAPVRTLRAIRAAGARAGLGLNPGTPVEHVTDLRPEVDGGVSEETIERCAEAGADVFVAGSAVYGSDDPARAVQALRAQAERATAHAAWGRPGR